MPLVADFHVSGLRELDAALKALPIAIQRRALFSATASGAKVLREAIKAAAPVRSGKAKKLRIARKQVARLGTKGWRQTRPGFLKAQIRMGAPYLHRRDGKVKASVHVGEAFYAYFLEHGTKRMSARPFFRQAYERASPDAIRRFAEKLREEIEAAVRRLASPGRATRVKVRSAA